MSESLTPAHLSAQRIGHGRREEDIRHERLARLLTQVTEGIICIDRNWHITFANEEARYRSKIAPSDLDGGRTLWEIYPHLEGTDLEHFYRNVMRTGEKGTVEYYSDRIDAWLNVSVYPTDEGIALYYHDVTDRKGAELLRDTSARQLGQVLETTTDSVASIDRDWNISFLNRRAKELLSPKGELLGKNLWHEFPVTEQNEEIRRYLERAMDEGVPSEFETFYPDPLNLWLSVQCRPFQEGIVLFFRDVTAERVSRQILLDQQATLAFVQQTARVATWEMDLVNRTVKFGEGSYPVYGRPFSELTTIDDLDKIIRPSDLVHVKQDAKRAIDTNTVSIVDYEVFTPEGGTLWVECRRVPVYNSAGVATHLRGMTSDITRRKRNEQALATSEERYRVLADLNPQAIWMGAPDGSITYGNQNFLDYIGLTIDELGGTGWLDAFYPGDRQRVLQAWTHSVTTGVDYDIEARMIRARMATCVGGGFAPRPFATTPEKFSTGSASPSTSMTAKLLPKLSSSARRRPSDSAPSSKPSTRAPPSVSPSSTPSSSATSASTTGSAKSSAFQEKRFSAAPSPNSLLSKGSGRSSSRSPRDIPFETFSSRANSPPAPANTATGT